MPIRYPREFEIVRRIILPIYGIAHVNPMIHVHRIRNAKHILTSLLRFLNGSLCKLRILLKIMLPSTSINS